MYFCFISFNSLAFNDFSVHSIQMNIIQSGKTRSFGSHYRSARGQTYRRKTGSGLLSQVGRRANSCSQLRFFSSLCRAKSARKEVAETTERARRRNSRGQAQEIAVWLALALGVHVVIRCAENLKEKLSERAVRARGAAESARAREGGVAGGQRAVGDVRWR